MYNSDTPVRAELPTSKQLFRSTILAIISAFIILVAVVYRLSMALTQLVLDVCSN